MAHASRRDTVEVLLASTWGYLRLPGLNKQSSWRTRAWLHTCGCPIPKVLAGYKNRKPEGNAWSRGREPMNPSRQVMIRQLLHNRERA